MQANHPFHFKNPTFSWASRWQKFHSWLRVKYTDDKNSTHNYVWNLGGTSSSSQSTHLVEQVIQSEGKTSIFWEVILSLYGMQLWNWLGKHHFSSDIRTLISHVTYYSLMFFIKYAFKGQVFARRVKIVSHSSCRTCAILKYFCPLASFCS